MATLERLPRNLEEVKALPESSLAEPQYAAVLTVAALCLYPSDKNAALEILDCINEPKEINGQNISFLDDRFEGKIMFRELIGRERRPRIITSRMFRPQPPLRRTFIVATRITTDI